MNIQNSIKFSGNRLKQFILALAVSVGLLAGSSQATTTTTVIDLGAFTTGGTLFNGGDLVKKINLGAVPSGSTLRSVTMHYRLAGGDPYLGDLLVLFADNAGDNGVLMVAGNVTDGIGPKSAGATAQWNSGADYSIGVNVTQTLTVTDGILPIDLSNYAVWLETTYGGTWEGSVTVEYDVPELADILSFGPGATVGPIVGNAATIAWTVPYGTNVTALTPTFTLSTGTCDKDNGGPTAYDFTNPVVYTVTDGATVNAYTVTVTVAPNETTVIWNVGSGAWDLTTSNWKGQTSGVSTPFYNGDNTLFNSALGGLISIASGVLPLSTTVSAPSGTYTFVGQPLTAGSITKDGGGTLAIGSWNTYNGGTIINNGTLLLTWPGDANPKTSLGTGPVTIYGGVLYLNRNILANALTVNGGSLVLDNGFGDQVTGPITLNVQLNVTTDYSNNPFSGIISGPGGITMTSNYGGGMNLSGTNTYTGPTTVLSGTMEFGNVDALGSGPLSISSGGAKAKLSYLGDHVVASLTLGGAVQLPGTYGATSSPTYFVGTGTVTVKPPGYAAWQAANGGTAQTLDQDLNNDGVANGIVYFTYGPVANSGFTPLPGVTTALDGTLSVTWTKAATYAGVYGTDYFVETSKTLTGWGIEIADPNPGFTVTFPTPTTVKFTFPTPLDPANFVRLRVTGP